MVALPVSEITGLLAYLLIARPIKLCLLQACMKTVFSEGRLSLVYMDDVIAKHT